MTSGHHINIVWTTSTAFCIEIDYEGMCAQRKKKLYLEIVRPLNVWEIDLEQKIFDAHFLQDGK